MRKRIRVVLASVCAFALVGAFALAGCSSNTEQQAGETQKPAEEQAKSESHEAVELQLFAANSLSKAMDAVQELYTQDHTWVTFKDTQYLSSGELNEQLAGGAYADVLISASKGKMDDAVEKGYVDEATRFDMFKNDLVMVAGEDSELAAKYADQSFTLDDLATGDYTVAVGDASVPAGNYTNQALSTVGCFIDADGKTGKDSAGTDGSYDGTPLEGKVNLQSSVGNVCKHAQSGDVDVAFVYTSDVYRFGGVQIVGTVPANTHKNIVYPGAVTSESKNAAATQEFLDWCLSSDKAQEIWQKWGFELA